MTSFIIKSHERRPVPTSWKPDSGCAFCRIVQGEAPAFKVFEDETVIAILDILPLRRGHALVIPKVHIARVSDLPPELAAATGAAVSKVANALTLALENTALNVVCNQEYAQAVPHVHYHIIPAPSLTSPPPLSLDNVDHVIKPLTHFEMHRAEFMSRSELDKEEADALLMSIRAKL